jgi:hypothetical protein
MLDDEVKKLLAKRLAENWDDGFRNMMDGKPLTEIQRAALKCIPQVPWGDCTLVVNPDAYRR